MLMGKKVTLKLFETETEIRAFSKMYNEITFRSDLDHTEVGSVFRR